MALISVQNHEFNLCYFTMEEFLIWTSIFTVGNQSKEYD